MNEINSLILRRFLMPRKTGYFILNNSMINAEFIKSQLQDFLDTRKLFLVDIHVSPQNQIEIIIDGDEYVNIEHCTEVSRYIESFLNRDAEDFSLIVSSPDASKPLMLPRQYPKHIGKDILIFTKENKEIKGKILNVNQEEIELLTKIKDTTQKKKKRIDTEIRIPFQQIKKAKIILPF